MSYSEFQKRCEDAAKHFLQSVVVIDNQAELYEGEAEHSVGYSEETELTEKKKALETRPSRGLSREYVNRAIEPREKSKTDDANETRSIQPGTDKSHLLQAWTLTKELADNNILCTVYRPDYYKNSQVPEGAKESPESHPAVIRSTKMAQLADIVVLDWELGGDADGDGDKGTWKAREIIKAVLRDDDQTGGRQRLLTIYTATPDLKSVYSDVVSDICAIEYRSGKFIQNKKDLSLSNGSARIVFLNKDTANTEIRNISTVSERHLPRRLIEEFVKLNRGLFPTIVLHSIASVRETTHHILSTFNSRLDPALISHRSLLPDPQDSEDFVLDLISGELRAALSLNQIGILYANADAHKERLAEYLDEQKMLSLGNDISVTSDEAIDLVTKGSEAFEKVCKSVLHRWIDKKWNKEKEIKHKIIPGKLSKRGAKQLIENSNIKDVKKHMDIPDFNFSNLIALFTKTQKDGIIINYEFSRLTTLKRERFGERHLPADWLPKLIQGSIIREIKAGGQLSDEFLLCIQPRCDSVRLKKKREFPFLVLTKTKPPTNTKKFLVVKCRKEAELAPKDITLWISPFPYRQKMLVFAPDKAIGDFIQAVDENGAWVFKNDETSYEWIADMKDFHVQNVCDLLSGRLGNMGLDEYEWLRRKSSS